MFRKVTQTPNKITREIVFEKFKYEADFLEDFLLDYKKKISR